MLDLILLIPSLPGESDHVIMAFILSPQVSYNIPPTIGLEISKGLVCQHYRTTYSRRTGKLILNLTLTLDWISYCTRSYVLRNNPFRK